MNRRTCSYGDINSWWLTATKEERQLYLPVVAISWNYVPRFILLSIHITATLSLLDTHTILGIWRRTKSNGVIILHIFSGWCISIMLFEPPAGQSRVDTGSLVYSYCWCPSRGLYRTMLPSHTASTPGQVDTLCHHLKQQQIPTRDL